MKRTYYIMGTINMSGCGLRYTFSHFDVCPVQTSKWAVRKISKIVFFPTTRNDDSIKQTSKWAVRKISKIVFFPTTRNDDSIKQTSKWAVSGSHCS